MSNTAKALTSLREFKAKYIKNTLLYQAIFHPFRSLKKAFQALKARKFNQTYARRFDENFTRQDKEYILKNQFKQQFGYYPNLDDPQTFNEKLQWLKLNYYNPLMTICADKVEARDYFRQKIENADKYLVKQLGGGGYSHSSEIDFDALPNTFILKSNWGSGLQYIVKDKTKIDKEAVKMEIDSWLDPKKNHYYSNFEIGYKDIIGKIICEEFLEFEYKLEFFCFGGEVKFFWIVLNDKTKQVQANFYTLDFKKIPLSQHYPNFDRTITKPACFDEVLGVAKKLCGDFPFVRCDFYITKDSYYFSEMTFFHWGANEPMSPPKYDLEFGQMLKLPS